MNRLRLELTVVRVAWTFNFEFGRYMLAGVLWMIVILLYLPCRWFAELKAQRPWLSYL